nr:MAG TPA: hypothetical protein [Caudoviricetes sp.]
MTELPVSRSGRSAALSPFWAGGRPSRSPA